MDFDHLYNISSGKHFYQFYKNRDDYLASMVRYFQAGLEKGDACLWIASERMDLNYLRTVATEMLTHGKSYFETEQIRIRSAEEWYLSHGNFDKDRALRNAVDSMEEALGQGFMRVRASGDLGAVPRREWADAVRAYENELTSLIKLSPIVVVCAYPILDCTLQNTMAVLDCHDDGVLIGKF